MSDIATSVLNVFNQKFYGDAIVVRAPGRINLIGEHTDYNEGFVLPAAIDRAIYFAMTPSGTDRCNLYSLDMEEGVSFSIHDLNPGETWVNYLMGVLDGFQRRGLPIHGVDCVFGGDIPVGGGMSSSAALCNGFGFGLNQIFSCGLDRLTMARISQFSEHEFAGVMCGLMDQYAGLFGEKNAALLLDCRSMTHEAVAVPMKDDVLLLVDTKVKHSLGSSAYNDRRNACEAGVKILQQSNKHIKSLRDVTADMLYAAKEKLDKDVFVKCLFVVEEIQRTLQAATFLKKGNFSDFGRLMYDTHKGLSKAYNVSCVELDLLVAVAEQENVAGARMMGGGFGGCTINLVRKDLVGSFQQKVIHRYAAEFGIQPAFYFVTLVDGVNQMKM